jgi:hypothetical protein
VKSERNLAKTTRARLAASGIPRADRPATDRFGIVVDCDVDRSAERSLDPGRGASAAGEQIDHEFARKRERVPHLRRAAEKSALLLHAPSASLRASAIVHEHHRLLHDSTSATPAIWSAWP